MIQTVSIQRNPNLSIPILARSSNEVQKEFSENWWTGLAPQVCPGFDSQTQTLKALPPLSINSTRAEILDYFNNSWTLTELLFASLKQESAYVRPPYHELRHPLIFYYGHPAVLYYNKLRLAGFFREPVDLYLEKILETGVDEMSWDDMAKNQMQWPSVASVHAYRQKVYNLILKVIAQIPAEGCQDSGPDSAYWALFMGFEHEKIHFETSSVLIRELPLELVEHPKNWPQLHESSSTQPSVRPLENQSYVPFQWKEFSKQTVRWGKDLSIPYFGWDNEYGHRQVELVDFKVGNQLISNGEYFEFVSSLAYVDDKYWSSEGLLWRKFRNCKRPTFWVAHGPEGLHEYKLRTLFEVIDMPWSWPVEVNFHEAQAFICWKNQKDQSKLHYRLMTEGEHVCLRGPEYKHDVKNYNVNFQFSSASPVQNHKNGVGISGIFGNVWQWLEDQFNPLEGFKPHPLYDDFSTPCFDGKHQMIKGGSFISCGNEATEWARFHFRPHFFQHAGFRIAASLDGSVDNGSAKIRDNKKYVHPKRANTLDQMQSTNWWKNVDQPLEINSTDLQALWRQTTQKIFDLNAKRSNLSPMGSALDPSTNSLQSNFQVPYQATHSFPTHGESFEKSLQLVFDELAPLGQQPGHPGYFAYVAGAGNPISEMSQALATALNPFTAHESLAPGLVQLENEALGWIKNLFGFPESSGAIFTTGGSLATVSALSCIRETRMQGHDLAKARFYARDSVHHCLGKALSFLGFPKQCLVLLDSRLDKDELKSQLHHSIQQDLGQGLNPLAVVGTAGSTNTGSVDDLELLGEVAQKFKLWFHVDAAYGGFFYLTKAGRNKLKGIEKADSLVLDPHKSMSLPYGTGCLIVRERSQMTLSYAGSDSYMPPKNATDFADLSPELSRDFRGLRFWLPLKYFGVGPFALNLEEKLELASHLTTELRNNPSIVIPTNPDLTIVTFRMSTEEKTKNLLSGVNSSNRFFLTSCKVYEETWIRVCLLGYRSHFAQVEELIKLISEQVQKINSI